jgi:hypothetical protein
MNKTIEVLKDKVLIRIPKTSNDVLLRSGIYLAGIEQDFRLAEVVAINPQGFYFNERGIKMYIEFKPGDWVILEKNFHHEYDISRRVRIDQTQLVDQDETHDYFITLMQDILLYTVPNDDGTLTLPTDIMGELYSIIEKKVKRVGI